MEPAALPPQLPQPRQPPQCEWSWLLPSPLQCRSANAPACCPRSTCSDRPQPLQCECTCLLPLLDLLRRSGLDLLGQTAAAAAVRLLRQTVAPQPRRPPQCEWSWLLPSPPQCECTCLLPSLDLLRQTVAPRPRQPAQCEWSGCTRRRSAAAVRMHLPAAPTAVRMEP